MRVLVPRGNMLQEWNVEFTAGSRAFGSGEHPTTDGCLRMLLRLAPEPRHAILDIGCGSGVLSLVAALLWRCPVLACDINREAVEATQANAVANQVEAFLTVLRSDGYSHSMIADRAPYDLILCNVLAEPVIGWAPDMASCLAPSGIAIISGMLLWQQQAVLEAHIGVGLELVESLQIGDWVTLLMQKPPLL